MREQDTKRPKTVPKRLRHGGYTARLIEFQDRTATWEIKRGRELVGRMFDGPSYGWGRPRASLDPARWKYKQPNGPRGFPNYLDHNWHDLGPLSEPGRYPYRATLKAFVKRCDYIIAHARPMEL